MRVETIATPADETTASIEAINERINPGRLKLPRPAAQQHAVTAKRDTNRAEQL